MTPFLLIGATIIAFAVSSLLVPIVRRASIARGWVDKPDIERKRHERPTPNVGGIAIFAGFAAGFAALILFGRLLDVPVEAPHLVFLAGAFGMMAVGFYDDIHGLSFKRKFFFQIIVAYALLAAGYRFDVSALSAFGLDAYNQALVSIPLTVIWIVGIINAVNLLDGLDGLASGVSMITFVTLSIVFALHGGDIGLLAIAFLMIASIGGFLVFNFNPASIFMGDSGSLFIGYMLAAYSLAGTAHTEPFLALIVPVVALGLPVLDTCLCMVRRVIDGISPFSPDSDHIHHRLRKLWTTRTAVVILYAVASWFGIAAILITQFELRIGLFLVAVTAIAAYVGIRTLGYLNVKKILIRRTDKGRQLSFIFAEDIPGPSWARRAHSNRDTNGEPVEEPAVESDTVTESETSVEAATTDVTETSGEPQAISSNGEPEHANAAPEPVHTNGAKPPDGDSAKRASDVSGKHREESKTFRNPGNVEIAS
jgi:UDP-GlcNAc:undecaprenyl-phosphate GlcNAc-1-phosphate transferase